MGTSLDALNAPSSLTQRRPAASNLPNFELPPPNLQFAPIHGQKFPPLVGHFPPQHGHASVSVGNLLTPPSNNTSEGSTSSSAIPTGTTPNNGPVPVLPYTPTLFHTGSTPGYHTGFTPQPWQGSNPLFPPRPTFSPLSAPGMRPATNSPTAGENSALPPPPYDATGVSSFAPSLALSSPTSVGGLPGHHQIMANPLMPNSGRPPSQHSAIGSNDGAPKPSQSPALFTNMPPGGTPQQPGYHYHTSTPVSQSPHLSNHSSRVSPPINQTPMSQQPHNPFIRPPYPSYSLPAMPGPAMSNVSSPGAQMSLVGSMQAGMLPMGFNSGYAANPQQMYAHQRTNSPQQPANNDRPFKCDQCPQSFNRNHDLKRHKRIHLAVKPFPCNHCDKSFSRKDALKRHILVKGCGNRGSGENGSREDGVKSESGSDIVTDSPAIQVGA